LVYFGGTFTYVGLLSGSGAPVDPAGGVPVAAYPRVDGAIYSAVPDGAGGWYLGGSFSQVAGQPRQNLAHVLANLAVDPVAPGIQGPVTSLAVLDGALYVGGAFGAVSDAQGVTFGRKNLAAFDVSGAVTAFDPAPDGPVNALVASQGRIYAGGSFSNLNTDTGYWTPSRNLAVFQAATGMTLPFGVQADGPVSALLLDPASGDLYLGGYFQNVLQNGNWQTQPYAAALDSGSGQLQSFAPILDGPVTALAVAGGQVFLGGQFTSVAGAPRNGLAQVSAGLGIATDWDAQLQAGAQVHSLAVQNGTLYVGGDFTQAQGIPRAYAAAFSTADGNLSPWDPAADRPVDALAPGALGI
ncbi:MAG TPA: hypothetical protein VNZ67_07600, partial [bacterium]|nr:hypothetical protein [bacterium]